MSQPQSRPEEVARALDDLQEAMQNPEQPAPGLVRPHHVTLTEQDRARNTRRRPRRGYWAEWPELPPHQRVNMVVFTVLAAVALPLAAGLIAAVFVQDLLQEPYEGIPLLALAIVSAALWLWSRIRDALLARRSPYPDDLGRGGGDLGADDRPSWRTWPTMSISQRLRFLLLNVLGVSGVVALALTAGLIWLGPLSGVLVPLHVLAWFAVGGLVVFLALRARR